MRPILTQKMIKYKRFNFGVWRNWLAHSHGVRKVARSSRVTPTMEVDKLYQSLLNASFRFVSYRPRSEKEIVDFLQKKLVKWKKQDSETFNKVLARLIDLEYIDDKKFADWWVEQRTRFRPKGNRVIEYELYQKGIAKDIISDALMARNSVEAAQKAIAKKKFDKKKLYEYLTRRGFDADTIKKVQYE